MHILASLLRPFLTNRVSKIAKMGTKGVCVVVGGHCYSVAEHWRLKPEVLGSTSGGATFLSCPVMASPCQRSTVLGAHSILIRHHL